MLPDCFKLGINFEYSYLEVFASAKAAKMWPQSGRKSAQQLANESSNSQSNSNNNMANGQWPKEPGSQKQQIVHR